MQQLACVRCAEGFVRQGHIQIERRLLAVAQQNILAEGDIRRGVGQRESLLHGENRGMLVNFAGNAKRLQVIEDARFVRHGQNPPFSA